MPSGNQKDRSLSFLASTRVCDRESIKNNWREKIMQRKFLDKLIFLSLIALFTVPFLVPYSYFPVTKFYSELLALCLASLSAILMIFRKEQISISNVGIACALFIVFLLLQIPIVNVYFSGINIDVAIEVLIGLALSIGVTSYVGGKEEGQQQLFKMIAWAIVIGALVQAIYGFLQYTTLAENFKDIILYVTNREDNVFGNVGQKNDYVDFITMGVFALAYLYFIKEINKVVFFVVELFFIVILSATTSRIPFVFFIFALLMAVVFVFANRKNTENRQTNRQIFYMLFGLIISLVIVEAILPKITQVFLPAKEATSGLYRFSADNINQSTYRRFYEWYKDIVIFMSHPLFGVGWFQYPKAAIDIMFTDPRFSYIPANQALYTHSHNTPLNILAETGIIGFAITIAYGVIYTLYRIFRNFNNYHTLFISFIILTMFAQGLFQYPLWYAYFLMYIILLLSVDKPVFTINNNKILKSVGWLLFICFIWFAIINVPIYNQLVAYTMIPKDSDDYANNVNQLKYIIDASQIWSVPSLMVMDAYNVPGSPQTNAVLTPAEQLKYADMMGNLLPYPGVLFKQIVTHKIAGDETGATYYANILAYGYPFFKDQYAKELEADPRFAAQSALIYNFKYEDRSIFSRTLNKKVGQ
ncbi:MAG: hypothetical protein K0R14_1388 [Burkholderiales bacterium]|jgi:O-antigen ligase|nr:hypothetical protein [Burkholderiales bacterium]